MAKNKGLTPHRKKELRNPRVKHKLKFRKALIRRKGAVSTSNFIFISEILFNFCIASKISFFRSANREKNWADTAVKYPVLNPPSPRVSKSNKKLNKTPCIYDINKCIFTKKVKYNYIPNKVFKCLTYNNLNTTRCNKGLY